MRRGKVVVLYPKGGHIVGSKPDFTAKIRRWVGETAYRRGEVYVREGRVRHPRRQGQVLEALCQGQAVLPYQVWVRLGEDDSIVHARCTCPAGSAGRCKHVAAVLLLWHTHPEKFAPAPPLAATLARWKKEDLIRLILRMVSRYPDLALWVMYDDKEGPPPSG